MKDSPSDLMRRANPEPDIELNDERKAAIRVKVDERIAASNGLGRPVRVTPRIKGRRGPLVAAGVTAAVIAIIGGVALMLPEDTPSAPADQPPAPLPETPGPDETPTITTPQDPGQPPSATPETLQVGDTWVESTPFGDARFTVIEPTWFEIEGTRNGFIDAQSTRFSTDLVTWVSLDPPYRDILALSDGSLVSLGDGAIAISTDMQTWTSYALPGASTRETWVAPLGDGFYVNNGHGPDLGIVYDLNRQIPELWADEPPCDHATRVVGGTVYTKLFDIDGGCDVDGVLETSGLEFTDGEAVMGSVSITASGREVVIAVDYANGDFAPEVSMTLYPDGESAGDAAASLSALLEATLWGDGGCPGRGGVCELETTQLRGTGDTRFGYIAEPAGNLRFIGATPNFTGVVNRQGTLIGVAEAEPSRVGDPPDMQLWRSTDGIEWTHLADAPLFCCSLRLTPDDRLVLGEEWFSDDGLDWQLGRTPGMGNDLYIGSVGLVQAPDSDFPLSPETWYSRTGAEWVRWESPVFDYARVLAVGDRIVIGSYNDDGPDPREIVIVVEPIE